MIIIVVGTVVIFIDIGIGIVVVVVVVVPVLAWRGLVVHHIIVVFLWSISISIKKRKYLDCVASPLLVAAWR